jgi:hypothetical protein
MKPRPPVVAMPKMATTRKSERSVVVLVTRAMMTRSIRPRRRLLVFASGLGTS